MSFCPDRFARAGVAWAAGLIIFPDAGLGAGAGAFGVAGAAGAGFGVADPAGFEAGVTIGLVAAVG
jgi:hypothetical protein